MALTDAQIRTIALCDGGGYQDDDNADWEFKDADLLKFARALLAAAPAQAEDAERAEQVNDRLCERLVIAQKHMTREQREAFEKEWSEFMAQLPQLP